MTWDASFKNLLKEIFGKDGSTEVITEFDVPAVNRRLDFLIRSQSSVQPPFDECRSNIIGEFKSERDLFTINYFRNTIGKGYLHLTTSDDEIENSLLCFVIGGRDRLIPELTAEYQIDELQSGIYRVEHDLDILIILLDLVEYSADNYFLALFGSQPIRREAIRKSLLEKEDFIRTYAYILYADEVDQVAKAENIEVDKISYNIEKLIELMGPSKVIEVLKRYKSELTDEQKEELRKLLED